MNILLHHGVTVVILASGLIAQALKVMGSKISCHQKMLVFRNHTFCVP